MTGRSASLGFALGALALVVLASAGPASAATFVVKNTNNGGPDSLRAAILAANATGASDTITFAIPGSGGHTITLTSVLPAVQFPVVLNAATQPGYAGSPLIRLDNGTGNAAAIGLDVVGGASKLQGLSITGFGTGIRLRAAGANTIVGDWIGLDLTGAAAGNATGVVVTSGSSSNVVGGSTAAARNVISGNTGTGVAISGAATVSNVVQGNYVGTTTDGAAARANKQGGILVSAGSTKNQIGGLKAGTANVVSGNLGAGVRLTESGTKSNLVEGNRIGTDAAGAAALPDTTYGVRIDSGAGANTVGGTVAGARNVILGSLAAVEISGSAATGVVVEGNYIGTNAAGDAALGTPLGVELAGGATANTIGGTSSAARNVISGATTAGVRIAGAGTTKNLVEANYIGTNAAGTAALANVDGVLVASGATANVIGGAASGARNLISGNDAPNATAVRLTGAGTTGNAVEGNFIGTDAAGGAALPNRTGVLIEGGADDNTIGGPGSHARNVISGNLLDGVDVEASGNVISANYIGTNAAGTAAVPNQLSGVGIRSGANDNTIGGTASGTRNVISGNKQDAVCICGPSSGNLVEGDYIGVNAAGDGAVSNLNGVELSSGAHGNRVGGTTASTRNVISGNTQGGVLLEGASTTANVVEGNYIGPRATGDGGLANNNGVAIFAAAHGNTVGGTTAGARNLFTSQSAAVVLSDVGTTANVVEGNWFGLTAAGGVGFPNEYDVFVHSGASGNTIGGTVAGARNVLAGGSIGIEVVDSNTKQNVIEGNYIGTDASGATAVPISVYGIDVLGGVGNTIGGTTAAARNVVASSGLFGIRIDGTGGLGSGGVSNVVQGNYVGTNAAGTGALPNAVGIELDGASKNTIGGKTAGAANVISGNTNDGISFADASSDNTVAGNRIGTNAAGSAPLGNGGDGVFLGGGANANTIGGTSVAAANTIQSNGADGVRVDGAGSVGDSVLENSIFANGGLGIELTAAGNDLQVAPAIGAITSDATKTTIPFSLSGAAASTSFRIELFVSPSCDASGAGEGKQLLGVKTATTNGSGAASGSLAVAPPLAGGQAVTATATNSTTGDTSQFSTCGTTP
ncbi:MAG TPA: hypothetical protein VFA66_13275 [Gaiellaceae bacterium]|nr:hypothetical protein [Gaiellaceae bacterium]